MGQLPSQDILALLEFKKGIKHDPTGYVLESWNEESIDFNGCPSSWNGIVCNGENIAGVVLDNLGISADVDLSVFANLTLLVKLSMANNSITGKIPDNVDSISGFVSIQSLDLSRNSFSGPLPMSLARLNNLVYLNLSSNEFTKRIPKGFELISSLQVFDLHGNMFDGHLDGLFFLETNASHVDISGNMLVSSSSQRLLPGMSGSIKLLNLSHNQLSGSFGSATTSSPGSVPNDLLKGDSLLLNELDLSANNLSGPISMIMSTTLRVLDLSSNALVGELPLVTGSCAVLHLSNNRFEGNLTRMVKWGDIEYLDLSQNHLTGPIPEIAPQFLRLNYLNLSHNSLASSLPKVITQYPKLRVLDLSSNQLDGSMSTDLLMSPTLQEIHLENNLLDGAIVFSPPSNSKSNLQVIDLSHNQLDGYFPDRFDSLSGLQVLNLAGNNLSGSLPSSMADMSSLISLDLSENHFTGPLPNNLSENIGSFNVSYNDLSGGVPENLRRFPSSSFYPGNNRLRLPNGPPGPNNHRGGHSGGKPINTIVKVVVIVACVIALLILIMLAIFILYIRTRSNPPSQVTNTGARRHSQTNPSGTSGTGKAGALVVSAEDLVASKKGPSSEIVSPDEKIAAVTGFSPAKHSHLSWSPESGDSFAAETLARLEVGSPDRLVGDLYFLDDTITMTPEELSRAPAEVLGRSSHGTSYRATLDSGVFITVKWLREGVAKQRKEFAKEAKKFANIRHPNVVGLRGYYWGPTQHEKLILSDYISPGKPCKLSLCGKFVCLKSVRVQGSVQPPAVPMGSTSRKLILRYRHIDQGRKGPPLTWVQRLKIAVDVARGLNYLHFDRAVPHGNLKATNILLDGPDLNARVADYCLHRLMTQSGTIEQLLDAGVLGYRAPELAASKKPLPSFKSDVYAFGMIMLELLTGRCAGDVISGEGGSVDLTDWVRLRAMDCFDPALVPGNGESGSRQGNEGGPWNSFKMYKVGL
ncbi:hypothetical protein OIU79_026209 [Salix purpurea]|uniref:Protein kinase domain-containing protein n=1 Tax=Salix purpurea TaxID=77065 RepID=A0A9Q1A0A4_SALPP|nr:hypothetical protein OIU79_026209 [Salix purpurea]